MHNVQADNQRGHPKLRRLLKFAAVLALFVGGGYAACAFIAPTYYIRYRLTLDVDVDGMVHRGTGVVEISYQLLPERLTAGFGGAHFRGEMRGYAITVDLGNRGLLYLVYSPPVITKKELRRVSMYPSAPSMGSLPLLAYGLPSYGTSSSMQTVLEKLQRLSGQVELRVTDLPMLVRFRNDMEGPAYEVDPQDLPTSFGKGVRISRARAVSDPQES